MALGTSHVVIITSDGTSDKIPDLNVSEFVLAPGAQAPHEILTKKRKNSSNIDIKS